MARRGNMRSSVSRPIAGRWEVLPLQAAPRPVEVSKKDGTPDLVEASKKNGTPDPVEASKKDGTPDLVEASKKNGTRDPVEASKKDGMPAPVEASKKDRALIRPATDGAQDGDLPPFFTEGAMLRLEEGLRAQREQQGRRHFSESDGVPSRTGGSGGRQTEEHLSNDVGDLRRTTAQVSRSGAHGREVQTIDSAEQTFPRYAADVAFERGSGRREADHDAPSFELPGWQNSRRSIENLHRVGSGPGLPDEIAQRRSPYWRWLKVDLLLCVLLLIVGAAAWGVSLEARTRGSTDAPAVNIKGARTASVSPDNDRPRQSITNGVKSPAATPSAAPSSKQPVEAQAPGTPAASKTPATPSLPPPTPAPPNTQPVQAQAPARPAASETAATSSLPSPTPAPSNKQRVEAQGPATPAVSETAATPSLPPPSPARPNKQPVEAQGPATPTASQTLAKPSLPPRSAATRNKQVTEAQGPATPTASQTLAKPSLPPRSAATRNKQLTEAQGPAAPAASQTLAKPSLPLPSAATRKKQLIEAQGPATRAASETPAASPQCNIPVCEQFYRSFRRSDCTYQPLSGGPRRICDR